MLLQNLVPLVASCFSPDFLELWVYPLFMCYFVASVPGVIRQLTSWR